MTAVAGAPSIMSRVCAAFARRVETDCWYSQGCRSHRSIRALRRRCPSSATSRASEPSIAANEPASALNDVQRWAAAHSHTALKPVISEAKQRRMCNSGGQKRALITPTTLCTSSAIRCPRHRRCGPPTCTPAPEHQLTATPAVASSPTLALAILVLSATSDRKDCTGLVYRRKNRFQASGLALIPGLRSRSAVCVNPASTGPKRHPKCAPMSFGWPPTCTNST